MRNEEPFEWTQAKGSSASQNFNLATLDSRVFICSCGVCTQAEKVEVKLLDFFLNEKSLLWPQSGGPESFDAVERRRCQQQKGQYASTNNFDTFLEVGSEKSTNSCIEVVSVYHVTLSSPCCCNTPPDALEEIPEEWPPRGPASRSPARTYSAMWPPASFCRSA